MNEIKLKSNLAVIYTKDKLQLDLGSPMLLMIEDEKPEPKPNIKVFAKKESHNSYDLF